MRMICLATMHRKIHSLKLYLLLLLIFVFCRSNLAKKDYSELLQSENIEIIFKFLTPERLLVDYRNNDDFNYNFMNSNCTKDLDFYMEAIKRRESWALKLLDASSNAPSGVLDGNIVDLGNYDECLNVKWKSTEKEINTHQCIFEINPKLNDSTLPFYPTMSICVPDSCTENDIMNLVNNIIRNNDKLNDRGISVFSAVCDTNKSMILWNKNYVFWIILGIYIIFIVLCTTSHIIIQKNYMKSHRFNVIYFLSNFSLIKSFKIIFNTKPNEDNLPVVNGLRVLSTTWIVYFHTYFLQFFRVNANFIYITEWYSSWRSIVFKLGNFSVDTFFVLSGFLMTYKFFKQIKKNREFNVIIHYFHRILRLTVPLAFFICIVIVVLPISSGPRAKWIQNIFSNNLYENWWSTLLYIQNFVDQNNYRILHIWSLCVDMQLYWISPIILYPLHNKPKIGLLILFTLLITTLITTATIVGINGYHTTIVTNEPNITLVQETFNAIYNKPYTRASPWLLGILLGYEVFHNHIKPTQNFFRTGWLITTIVLITFLLVIKYETANIEYSLFREMMFAVILRPTWSFCICWIIYANINNPEGIISKLLSWKYYLPLSRICYCVYLIHVLFPVFRISTDRTSTYFSDIIILQNFLMDLILSSFLGFLLCLTVETPICIFEEMILKKKIWSLNENEKIK